MLFETERLIVRQWEDPDYLDLFEYASEPVVTKFLHFKPYETVQTAKDRISVVRARYAESNGFGEFAIELKQNHKVIGAIAIDKKYDKAGGIAGLGWVLNAKYQGKGYMTECAKEALKYIKRNKLAMRIVATHDTANDKSGNVMKRIGMTLEGISRKASDNNFHKRHDVANYAILVEDIKL